LDIRIGGAQDRLHLRIVELDRERRDLFDRMTHLSQLRYTAYARKLTDGERKKLVEAGVDLDGLDSRGHVAPIGEGKGGRSPSIGADAGVSLEGLPGAEEVAGGPAARKGKRA